MGRLVSRFAMAMLTGIVVMTMSTTSSAASVTASSKASAFVCGRGLENPPCEARPAQLEFSDNHDLVAAGMTWRNWGKSSTLARGDVTVNWTGTPSTHRGTVKLYDLRSCNGTKAYRTGRVSWSGESVVIHFDCRAIPGQPRYVEFHSRDLSLGCGMVWDPKYGSSARCDVDKAAYTTPLTADCKDLDQGDSLSLEQTVGSTCHGDTVLRAGSVLGVGHAKRVGDIRCSMARDGVTCRNLVSGHGFRMSKDSYETW
jgi:hypothetical protein